MNSGSQEKMDLTHIIPYNWKYIDDEFIASPSALKDSLISNIIKNEQILNDIFYEILLTVSEYPYRVSQTLLIQLLSEIFSKFSNSIEKINKISELFIILSQSFKNNKNLSVFIRDCNVAKKFKILYMDKSLLKSENIFPDYGKYQYIDARSRVFAVDSYSSLHESSEGYSKFISQIFSYFDTQSSDLNNVPTLMKLLNRIMAEYNLDNKRCFLLMLNILSFNLNGNSDLVLEIFKNSVWWNSSEHNIPIQTTVVDYLLNYVGLECKELKLITLLIKENVLDFHSIYNSLGPLDIEIIDSVNIKEVENNEINELYEATKNKLKDDAQIATASALALAAPLLPDSDDEDSTTYKKSSDNTKNEKNIVEEKKTSILSKAQLFRKINFLEFLLDFEMLDEILFVLVQYPEIPLIYDHIADKLNNIVEKFISPFYFQNSDNFDLTNSVPEKEPTLNTIENIDDFLIMITKYLSFNKYKLARSPSLLTKIIRIMKYSLKNNMKDSEFWLQFYRHYIFPCLSFTNNIPLVNEAFSVLSQNYSLETRYNLYGEYQFVVKKDTITKLNHDLAEKKTRDILKRLSIENVNISCRTLNKLVSTNPIATSNTFISHIESYNSLIDLVCESSKFFNDFAWDVITFQLLTKLYSNRSPVQSEGLNYSQWFVNLSHFIGKLGKLYPESFQLSPILLSIIKSFSNGDSNVLAVVQELIDSMTGIKSITNLNTKQIMRMNAERSLRQLAYLSIQDSRESCNRSCSKLLNIMIDDKIFAELFILLCHIPINLIALADEKPLKFINQRCDDVTSLIHSLIFALDLNLKTDIFKDNMISIIDLIEKFKIQPQWAFQIWRRHLSREIKKNDNKSEVVFNDLQNEIMSSLPFINWDLLNVKFYLAFWQMSLYDINFNDLSYMMEYSDLRSQLTGINMKLRHKGDLSSKEIRSLEDNHKHISSILSYINEDMKIHEDNYKLTLERLNNEKETWFKSDKEAETEADANNRSLLFLEHCVFPRLQHSSFDAVFVAKFILFLYTIETPGYSLENVLGNLFTLNILPNTFYTNTTIETENLALFFQLLIEKLHEWWSKSEVYEKECKGFNKNISYDDFRKMLFEWHLSLLNQILQSLTSESYTTRNNSILFLKTILSNFPLIEQHADLLGDKLTEIIENDERDDIKLASRALIGLLKFQQNRYIPIWEFYEMDPEDKEKALKLKAEKDKLERQSQEEERKKQLENEKLELEKVAKSNPPSKPYGLVGLGAKKAPESVKSEVSTPSKSNGAIDDDMPKKKLNDKNEKHDEHNGSSTTKPSIASNILDALKTSKEKSIGKSALSPEKQSTDDNKPSSPKKISPSNSNATAANTKTAVIVPSGPASISKQPIKSTVNVLSQKSPATTSTSTKSNNESSSSTQSFKSAPASRTNSSSNTRTNTSVSSSYTSQKPGNIDLVRPRYGNTNSTGNNNWNKYDDNQRYYNNRSSYNHNNSYNSKTSYNNKNNSYNNSAQRDDRYLYQNRNSHYQSAPPPPPPPPTGSSGSSNRTQNSNTKTDNKRSSSTAGNSSDNYSNNYNKRARH
jgi:hypothetical protein